jgi:hypothetical protein
MADESGAVHACLVAYCATPPVPRSGSIAGSGRPSAWATRRTVDAPGYAALVITDAVLRSYDALVSTHPGLTRMGKTMPYTSVNGHMFSFLAPDGTLALRLPPEDRHAFVERYASEPVVQHGAVMTEYVAVPGDLLDRLDELTPWFDRSVEHVSGLKPKATTRSG